jgi:hypothetical protein
MLRTTHLVRGRGGLCASRAGVYFIEGITAADTKCLTLLSSDYIKSSLCSFSLRPSVLL